MSTAPVNTTPGHVLSAIDHAHMVADTPGTLTATALIPVKAGTPITMSGPTILSSAACTIDDVSVHCKRIANSDGTLGSESDWPLEFTLPGTPPAMTLTAGVYTLAYGTGAGNYRMEGFVDTDLSVHVTTGVITMTAAGFWLVRTLVTFTP